MASALLPGRGDAGVGGGGRSCGGGGPSCSPRGALPLCHSTPLGQPQPPARDVTCLGYVGQGARPAGEYHECDFDWAEHARAVRHLVEAQEAQALALRLGSQGSEAPEGAGGRASPGDDAGGRAQAAQAQVLQPQRHGGLQGQQEQADGPSGAAADPHSNGRCSQSSTSMAAAAAVVVQPPTRMPSSALAHHTEPQQPWSTASQSGCSSSSSLPSHESSFNPSSPDGGNEAHGSSAGPSGRAAGRTSRRAAPAPGADPGAAAPAVAAYEGGRWEEFYRSHPSARFFKERRYLLLEFPELLTCGHVAEIGCGCGSSILPVLKANTAARTTCTDISTTCLAQLRDAAAAEGIAPARIAVFPADATDPAAAPAFDGLDADALLIMFTLSAVMPERQAVMLAHAWRALRPGGRLMLRDHGLYDMVQLRIPADQWVGPNLYKRGDGTMAYFFSTEELAKRAAGAGFETVECKYVTVINRNRKTGVELRRVFVHGIFEKPAA